MENSLILSLMGGVLGLVLGYMLAFFNLNYDTI